MTGGLNSTHHLSEWQFSHRRAVRNWKDRDKVRYQERRPGAVNNSTQVAVGLESHDILTQVASSTYRK